MKKRFLNFIILTIAVFAFSLLPQFAMGQKAFAATFANTSTQIRLVGYSGYQPAHYFDSLSRAKTSSPSNYYYSGTGSLTKTYNIIAANNSNIINERSKGSSSFAPFGDYVTLANKNVLYVYGQAGIVSGGGEKNDITISISNSESTQSRANSAKGSTNSSGYYVPHYFKTDAVLVKANKNITFSFTNNASASWWSGANFKLFEPSVLFETRINEVNLKNNSSTAYINQVIKLDASNSVLDIAENTSLISYYKNKHKIEYEVVEGADKASIIGNHVYFTGTSSGTVKIRAKALKSSEGSAYVYSKTITYNYIAEQKTISVSENFEGSASIAGQGNYYINEKATLIARMNSGYNFSHWLYNGQQISSQTLQITVGQTNNIQLFAIKKVEISKIIIKEKEYDSTTAAEIESVVINGILSHHNVKVVNLNASFYTASPGTKIVQFASVPKLEGADAKWYLLSETVPSTTATIVPRILRITFEDASKIYGDYDPEINYIFEDHRFIHGDYDFPIITRQKGEDVGEYEIYANLENPNYTLVHDKATLTINKRKVEIVSTYFEIMYEKTATALFMSPITNIQFLDDVVAHMHVKFPSANVQSMQTLEIVNLTLFGEKSSNYYFGENIPEFKGSILPKMVFAQIDNATKTYGNADPQYSYNLRGVLDGDELGETLFREQGENVGQYEIRIESTNNNYRLEVQGNPMLFVSTRQAEIIAQPTSKIYGEQDPEIVYQANGVLSGDALLGQLSRQMGEDAGVYQIEIGTLKNSNYILNLKSSNFIIEKRQLETSVLFSPKTYDGTKKAQNYTYTFSNLAFNDNVELVLDAELESAQVKENVKITINSFSLNNPNYTFLPQQYHADILPRNLYVNAMQTQKIYGEQSPEIEFTTDNAVVGDEIVGTLERAQGEGVGAYQIELGTLNNQNNPNYNIVLSSNTFFVINKKNISITTQSQEKQFGESDPNPIFNLYQTELAFDHNLEEVVQGTIIRVEGQAPGRYLFQGANLTILNNNYNVEYIASGALTVLKADITVSAVSTTKVYGDIDPVLEFTTNKQVVENFELNLIREQGENVGAYKITYASLYHEYYNIEYQEGVFEIVPRSITIKPVDQAKFYGDGDPQVAFTIRSGILINGDTLSSILNGETQREQGEDVGLYNINVGSLTSNENYMLSFESGKLTILQQEIEIKADNKTKQFGFEDSSLTYTIQKGFFAFEDISTGKLERVHGEEIGTYQIRQGTFLINENYNITFIEGLYTISKAEILITVPNLEKTYGDNDPEITYEISGNFYSNFALVGSVSRTLGEDVGEYDYISSLSSPYYEIEYNLGKFEVVKRIIEIKARSYTITYGTQMPELELEIVSGTILPHDNLTGDIYKVSGNNVGVYDINSTLNLGRNYQILFQKGSFEIIPAHIKIVSDGAKKVYGQQDPNIPFEIFEGNLIGSDVLTGKLSRKAGEDIGVYILVPAFTNPNYNIEVINGKFEITPKEVSLYVIVEDKVYDSTTSATIKRAEVIGVSDQTVSLHYNKNTSAKFESVDIANQVQVNLSNIFLIGDKSYNYTLVLPQVHANITHNQLEKENVKVYAKENTQLKQGTVLEVENINTTEEKLKQQNVVSTFAINLLNNSQEIQLEKEVSISINLGNKDYQNVKVYLIDENNNSVLISSTYKNGNLTFATKELGKVMVVSDNLAWLDISTIISVIFLSMITFGYVFIKIKNQKTIKSSKGE